MQLFILQFTFFERSCKELISNYVNCAMSSIKILQASYFKKVLLKVILLLSLTSFSGYNGSFHSKQQQSTNPELIYSDLSSTKRSISYKRALLAGTKNLFFNFSKNDFVKPLSAYNILVKVKADHLASQILIFSLIPKFIKIKAIHQDLDENSLNSL